MKKTIFLLIAALLPVFAQAQTDKAVVSPPAFTVLTFSNDCTYILNQFITEIPNKCAKLKGEVLYADYDLYASGLIFPYTEKNHLYIKDDSSIGLDIAFQAKENGIAANDIFDGLEKMLQSEKLKLVFESKQEDKLDSDIIRSTTYIYKDITFNGIILGVYATVSIYHSNDGDRPRLHFYANRMN